MEPNIGTGKYMAEQKDKSSTTSRNGGFVFLPAPFPSILLWYNVHLT